MDEDQTILQTPVMDTEEGPLSIILIKAMDNLKL